MINQLKILATCPGCHASLLNPDIQVDENDAIDLLVKIGSAMGHIYLSQIYGSYNKQFGNVEDVRGAIVECSCPSCYTPFPVHGLCECKAPMIGLGIQTGGTIKVCTRNGCKKHALEFENADDAFFLFQNQDDVGLL